MEFNKIFNKVICLQFSAVLITGVICGGSIVAEKGDSNIFFTDKGAEPVCETGNFEESVNYKVEILCEV